MFLPRVFLRRQGAFWWSHPPSPFGKDPSLIHPKRWGLCEPCWPSPTTWISKWKRALPFLQESNLASMPQISQKWFHDTWNLSGAQGSGCPWNSSHTQKVITLHNPKIFKGMWDGSVVGTITEPCSSNPNKDEGSLPWTSVLLGIDSSVFMWLAKRDTRFWIALLTLVTMEDGLTSDLSISGGEFTCFKIFCWSASSLHSSDSSDSTVASSPKRGNDPIIVWDHVEKLPQSECLKGLSINGLNISRFSRANPNIPPNYQTPTIQHREFPVTKLQQLEKIKPFWAQIETSSPEPLCLWAHRRRHAKAQTYQKHLASQCPRLLLPTAFSKMFRSVFLIDGYLQN